MPKHSAGILMYRRERNSLHVLLVHPGGPFWKNRDDGAWSIPKGECEAGEDALSAARREFREELGSEPIGDCVPLGDVRQKSGKVVTAFALRGDFDPATLRSAQFEMEWPPKSGKLRSFPEVDRAQWFSLTEAHRKILPAQSALLDRVSGLTGDSER
ncbi:MAG: NUDIX domain-containing protein [Pseudorhodoplanes sp.]